MENLSAKFHQWFNIPYRLNVRSYGNNGPVIIMLHGIATSSASWNFLIPLLEPTYRCITIDLLGFGESPKPDWYDYTPEEHIKNIHHAIKRLGLKEPFILMGHSMGGLLALHYANKYSNKVDRLIILSPPIYFTSGEMQKAKRLWRETLYARAYSYIRTHKNLTLRGASGLKNLVLKNNPFLITESTWLSFSRSLENCIEKQNVAKDLEQIYCPIDIFYGTLDQLILKKNIQYLTHFLNVKIHTIRSGHAIGIRFANATAQLLVDERRDKTTQIS